MPDPWTYAKTSEHSHQAALFMWANMACQFGLAAADNFLSYSTLGYAVSVRGNPIPSLKWLHAIHNQGHGDAIRGGKAKAEGVKAGVADIFLPVPRFKTMDDVNESGNNQPYHGLYIELKVGKNKPDDKQIEFQIDMKCNGYASEIAYGWLEARQKILDYLSISC